MTVRFGTDGWRGVMARDFTFSNVRRVVAAVAGYLEEQGTAARGVALGYDRRFLSDPFAREAAGVLAARGIPVQLSPSSLPTPMLSWAVRDRGLAGGLVITASHNPPEWNGIKFKEPFGGASRNAVTARIEEILHGRVPPGDAVACLPLDEARAKGLVTELDTWESYAAGVRRLVDFDALRRARLTVAVDAMHGCGAPWLERFLEEAGCRVVALRSERDPYFGGAAPEPVERNLGLLMRAVREHGCHLGVANDGDADRIGAVDERGRYFSPQRILAVLFRHLRRHKGLPGDVARAVSGTALLDLLAQNEGCRVFLTPIGFKNIGEVILEHPIVLGGEESGGIGVPAHLPERDGILNALLLAEIVAVRGKGLRACLEDLFAEVGRFIYERLDLSLDPPRIEAARERLAALAPPDTLAGKRVVAVQTIDGTRLEREDASWLLMRPSGTEPLVRIYAEARSREEVTALLAEGRRLAGV